jgi:hypothetical protein
VNGFETEAKNKRGEPEPNHKSRPVLTSDENNYSFSGLALSIQPKIPKHIDDGDYYPIVITEKKYTLCVKLRILHRMEYQISGVSYKRRSSRESAGFSFPIYIYIVYSVLVFYPRR